MINNAGIWLGKEIHDVTLDEYHKLISINLTGVFLGTKYLTPFLNDAGKNFKYGSTIVNLSSVAGLVGSQLDPLYSMTKGGITTFTKSMAIYYGKKNYALIGLLYAATLHGVYDFVLMSPDIPEGIQVLGFIGCIIFGIRVARKSIKLHQDNSPFKNS